MQLRLLKNQLFTGLVVALTLVALMPLFLILFDVVRYGLGSFSLAFFTESQPPPNAEGGGVANALLGTVMLAGLATLFSIPPAIFAGLYLSQNSDKKSTQWIFLSLGILQTIPAIVIGIIAYLWVVKPMGGFSLFSGAVALAMLMLPYAISAAVEIFKLVPYRLCEAAYALGAPFYRVALRIILPISIPGVASASLVALARAVGEAAPLLFTAFGNPYFSFALDEPVGSLTVLIFQFGISPYASWRELAWGASFVLLLFIFSVNFSVKLLTRKKYHLS